MAGGAKGDAGRGLPPVRAAGCGAGGEEVRGGGCGVRDRGADATALCFLRDKAGFRPGQTELAAVIGGRYPLGRIADAHARVDAGHKKGNIVVTMP
jgi:hypothetical protein